MFQYCLTFLYLQSILHQTGLSRGTAGGCRTTTHVSPHQRNRDKRSDPATPGGREDRISSSQ